MVRSATLVRLAALVISILAWPAVAGDFAGAFARTVMRAGIDAYAVELRLTGDSADTVAMSARYSPGLCTIVALESSPYVDDAVDALDPLDRPVFLEALFAHEIAHCEDRHRSRVRPGAAWVSAAPVASVAAALTAGGVVVLKPVDRLELWGEMLADAYMVHYLRHWHPEQVERIAAAQFARRLRDAASDPAHETASWLRGADFSRIPGQTLIEAALRTRAAALERARP